MVKPKQKAVIQRGRGFKATDLGTSAPSQKSPTPICPSSQIQPQHVSGYQPGGRAGGQHLENQPWCPPKMCTTLRPLHCTSRDRLFAGGTAAWSETAASLHTDEGFNSWCGQNTLELSPLTTVEVVGAPPPLYYVPSPYLVTLWLLWTLSGSWEVSSPRTWRGPPL